MKRATAVLLLIILAVITFHPVPVTAFAGGEGTLALRTLDVCHSQSGGAGPDLPYLLECFCSPDSPSPIGIRTIPPAAPDPFLLAVRVDRPPKLLL